jgi:hypothetical protein
MDPEQLKNLEKELLEHHPETDPERAVRFVRTFNQAQSKSHFGFERLEELGAEIVTIRGREAASNMPLILKITRDMFNNLLDNFPDQLKDLMEDYYTRHVMDDNDDNNKRGSSDNKHE